MTAALAGVPDWEGLLDGNQYACVGERTAEIGEDEIVITERNIVVGDARMRL